MNLDKAHKKPQMQNTSEVDIILLNYNYFLVEASFFPLLRIFSRILKVIR
jgi:hypothetical protein